MGFSQMFFTAAGVALIVAGLITAQDNGNGRGDTDKDARTMTVTGCLAKNPAAANGYVIKSGEGMSYGLQPGGENLNLRTHLGHKVTVSGIALKGKGPHDADRIRVTNLVMISTTCP